MHPKVFFLVLFSTFSLLLFGQQSELQLSSLYMTANNSDDLIIAESDWAFYADKENATVFIDFEEIEDTATQLEIISENDEVLLTEDLTNVPFNTIYELDVAFLNSGKYSIRIKTYNETINKTLDVK